MGSCLNDGASAGPPGNCATCFQDGIHARGHRSAACVQNASKAAYTHAATGQQHARKMLPRRQTRTQRRISNMRLRLTPRRRCWAHAPLDPLPRKNMELKNTIYEIMLIHFTSKHFNIIQHPHYRPPTPPHTHTTTVCVDAVGALCA